ncbi:MAG: FtsX-like permease family protein [Nakamurella sp.]
MMSFARSAVRVYRSSLVGAFATVVLAAALLTVTGVWIQAGIALRNDPTIPGHGMLLAVASSFAGTTLLVVGFVVSSVFSQSLRQRERQFALLRAVGATPRQVRGMITAEVLLVFSVAAPIGSIAGFFVAPQLTGLLAASGLVPEAYNSSLSPWPALGSLLILLPTGLIAARIAARRVTRPSVAAAGRASAVDSATIGRGRSITAIALAATGVVVAATPLFVGGLAGSAGGGLSAILLIIAATLGGPVLVSAASRRMLSLFGARGGATSLLAIRGARGFSRRLSGAVAPLALLIALGVVQISSNAIAGEAAVMQLSEGITSNLVVQSSAGLTQSDLAALDALPAVASVEGVKNLQADVRINEDDDVPFFSGLEWETTELQLIPADGTVDPDVTAGSLSDLTGPNTIAVSKDAVFGTSTSIGGTVELRFSDGIHMTATIVAIYQRGLGFGDYLAGQNFAASRTAVGLTSMALVNVAPGATRQVSADVSAMGLEALSASQYAHRATASGAGQHDLSVWLTCALLAFVGLVAANILVMLTAARSGEFRLLRRIGATRKQIVGMITKEAMFIALTAIAIGSVSVAPALLGIGYGLLGSISLGISAGTYGTIVGVVMLIAVGALVPVAVRVTGARR